MKRDYPYHDRFWRIRAVLALIVAIVIDWLWAIPEVIFGGDHDE